MTTEEIKHLIDSNIYENYNNEITATSINQLLKDIVDFANSIQLEDLNINKATIKLLTTDSITTDSLTCNTINATSVIGEKGRFTIIDFGEENTIMLKNSELLFNSPKIIFERPFTVQTVARHETYLTPSDYSASVDPINLIKSNLRNKIYRIAFDDIELSKFIQQGSSRIQMMNTSDVLDEADIDKLFFETTYDILCYIFTGLELTDGDIKYVGKLITHANTSSHINFKKGLEYDGVVYQTLILNSLDSRTTMKTIILRREAQMNKESPFKNHNDWYLVTAY